MINYICAALCGLCALLLVVILRQRQKIRYLTVENDTLNDIGLILTGYVIKLKNRELLKSEEGKDD
jgi:hypothetical protein